MQLVRFVGRGTVAPSVPDLLPHPARVLLGSQLLEHIVREDECRLTAARRDHVASRVRQLGGDIAHLAAVLLLLILREQIELHQRAVLLGVFVPQGSVLPAERRLFLAVDRMGGARQPLQNFAVEFELLDSRQEVLAVHVQVELRFGGQAGALESRLARELAHGDDGLHRPRPMPVGFGQQHGPQHAGIDLHYALAQHLPGLPRKHRAQQDGPPQHVKRIVCTRPPVGAEHVDIALEAAEKIRNLGGARLVLRHVLAEVIERLAGSARKHEDGLADGMCQVPVLEFAVLHGRQEVSQPAIRAVVIAVELVPENQGDLTAQPDVADLVESGEQFLGGPELGQVEFLGLDFARPERQCKLRDAEGFSRSRRPEHGDRQGALGTRLRHILAHQGANAA